jgi:hypothetical protein
MQRRANRSIEVQVSHGIKGDLISKIMKAKTNKQTKGWGSGLSGRAPA